jgi:hypothetical protein
LLGLPETDAKPQPKSDIPISPLPASTSETVKIPESPTAKAEEAQRQFEQSLPPPPKWVKESDYVNMVEQMLYTGRYAHTFTIGPISVVFRTLLAEEEDACWAAAIASAAGQGLAGQTTATRNGIDYQFACSIAALRGGELQYVAPTTTQDVKQIVTHVFQSVLRSAPLRMRLRELYVEFVGGVNAAMMNTLKSNF